MTGVRFSASSRWRGLTLASAIVVVATAFVRSSGSSSAARTAVSGSATAFLTNVSLFGGPASERGPAGNPGCDPKQPVPGPSASQTEGCSITVTLPSKGTHGPITARDADGARAIYGPAAVFSGLWRDEGIIPPTGPITVSTEGTTRPHGSATSSVTITRAPPGSTWAAPGQAGSRIWPGGIGPGPVIADGLTTTCTASEDTSVTGAAATVTGSTTISNGRLGLNTDEGGIPLVMEPMPANPRPNDGPHRGILTNIGDSYEVTYNEQDVSVPGSITVTAIHMRMLGPVAVGDVYIGQVHCGVRAGPAIRAGSST